MTQDLHQPSELRPKRSVGKWMALLVIWAIGLAVWSAYVAMLFVGFLRVFSS